MEMFAAPPDNAIRRSVANGLAETMTIQQNRERLILRRLAAEAVVTLVLHAISAIFLIALIALFGMKYGEISERSTAKFLFWSGVGIATGVTVTTSALAVFFIGKMRAARRRDLQAAKEPEEGEA